MTTYTPGFIDLVDFERMAESFSEYERFSYGSDPFDDEQLQEMLVAQFGDDIPLCNLLPFGATTMQHECRAKGHQQLHDCSTVGPDSGNMDHECLHCGEYFRHTLY